MTRDMGGRRVRWTFIWVGDLSLLMFVRAVCYQYNLRFEGHGYIEGVNHQLGDAVVAMGAIMIVL